MESNTETRKPASLSKVQDDKLILVLGAPRSGTTWLAKIFDSHPQVVYRHEPDTVDRDLQGIFRSDQLDQHRKAAHDYLHRLLQVNTLKSSGSLPIFRKHHHNPLQHQFRTGMIYTLRALEKLGRPGQMATWIRVPDMIDSENWDDLKVVVKSVSSLGRVRLFAEALPSARIVFIVRHPCGQIASMMRGVTLGKFGEPPVREILGTEQARQYGLTEKRLDSLPAVEQFAWHWAILNERAIEDLTGLSAAKVVRYQDLCTDPLNVSKDLLAFSGLSWSAQTQAFIAESTCYSGRDRYYQVYKRSSLSLNKWRDQLDREDRRRILAVVRQTSMRALYPEHETPM
jgi:Sulfotransferase family